MCFGGCTKRTLQLWIDFNRLSNPTRPSLFKSTLAEKLKFSPPKKINEYWSLIKNVLHSASLVSCGLIRRLVIPWISAECVHFLEACQFTPIGSEFDEA